MRKSRLVCIEIIDSADVFVHIPHRENATCRTIVYVLANKNPFLKAQQYSRLAKTFLWSQFSGKYTNFVKNFIIIVNLHHLLPLLVQIVLWMILIVCDLGVSLFPFFVIVYTSLIDLWVLKMIFDPSLLSVDCSPGGAEFLVWKAMSSHFVSTVITHEDFLRLFLETTFMLSFAGGRFAVHSWTSILVLS